MNLNVASLSSHYRSQPSLKFLFYVSLFMTANIILNRRVRVLWALVILTRILAKVVLTRFVFLVA